jgi:D-alanine-D-alanine ligase
MHPVHSDLPIICRLSGMAYRDLLTGIIESASVRLLSPRTVSTAA